MASLKYVANSSLQTVTLGSAYTAASGTMTLTTGQGSRLPTTGDFWLVYAGGGTTYRIYKVTARSTDTLTVVADATEGSGDANIASGETLRWALTVAALDQLKADILADAAASGGLVWLGTQTASSSASLDFTSLITSTYDNYVLQVQELLPATDGAALGIQVSTDNGSNWITSSSYAWANHLSTNATAAVQGSLAATQMSFAFNQDSSTSDYGCSFTINIYNPLGTSLKKIFQGTGFMFTSASFLQVCNFYGAYVNTQDVDAIRIIASSGNLASGIVRLYGVSKTAGGGGGGTGDVVGPASSVASEVALFDGTTGKLLKSATGTGVAHLTSGVLSPSNVVLTSEVSGILPAANGGTNNGFTEITGPTTSTKTFTLPNASATILTSNSAVTVAQGGTGATTLTSRGILFGNGTSAVGATSAGTSGQLLTSNGSGSDPTFQTATKTVQQFWPVGGGASGALTDSFSPLGTGYTAPTLTANTNPSRAYATLPPNAGSPYGYLFTWSLPDLWDSSGSTVITFFGNSNPTTGDRTFSVETACISAGDSIGGTITFSTAQTVTVSMSVDNQLAKGSITLNSTSLSGAAAGDMVLLRITRSDAVAGNCHFRGISMKWRETLN